MLFAGAGVDTLGKPSSTLQECDDLTATRQITAASKRNHISTITADETQLPGTVLLPVLVAATSTSSSKQPADRSHHPSLS